MSREKTIPRNAMDASLEIQQMAEQVAKFPWSIDDDTLFPLLASYYATVL